MRRAGEPAPDFELPNGDGRHVTLRQLRSEAPALLAFFKISCPVCQFTFPFLERLANESGLRVVGVSQDSPNDTREFCSGFGITFPILFDSAGTRYRASNAYGITHVPSLFLVEPDGSISAAESGFSRPFLADLGARFGTTVFRGEERVPEYKPG
jgi:peroxiredoxin